jgi:hypothetical protein
MRFKMKKRNQREEYMALSDNFFAALASPDSTTLLNAAMILFDIPSKILEQFSIRFRCVQDMGRPMSWFLVGVNNPEHLDETVLAQVHNAPFGENIDFRNITG